MKSTVSAWVPIATAFGGIVLGWALNYVGTQRTLRAERQREIAAQWRAALVDVWLRARPTWAIRDEVRQASQDWYRAWLLYSGAVPESVSDRVEPLHLVLLLLAAYAPEDRSGEHGTLEDSGLDVFGFTYVVETAFRDATATLDAFIAGDSAPPRAFPTGDEVMSLMTGHDDDQGLVRLRHALNELPRPPRSRSRITIA